MEIIKGKWGLAPPEGKGEYGGLLASLKLGIGEVAKVLGFSHRGVVWHRTRRGHVPNGVLLVLRRAQNKEEALRLLSAFVAESAADYVKTHPFYEQVFELHKVLSEKGIGLGKLSDRSHEDDFTYRRLGTKDLTPLLGIARADLSLQEMRRRVASLYPHQRWPAPAFYRDDRPSRILREAPAKFGLNKTQLARLLGVRESGYFLYARGSRPVPNRWADVIEILAAADSLADLKEGLAKWRRLQRECSAEEVKEGTKISEAQF